MGDPERAALALVPFCQKTLVDHICQLPIFERGRDPLFVIELFVDRFFLLVASFAHMDIDFEARGQASEELHPDTEPNQGCHRAMRDRRGEIDPHRRRLIVNLDMGFLGHLQLLERQWVLWILYASDQICRFKRRLLLEGFKN